MPLFSNLPSSKDEVQRRLPDRSELAESAGAGARDGAVAAGVGASLWGSHALDRLSRSATSIRPPAYDASSLSRYAGRGALAGAVSLPAIMMARQVMSGRREEGAEPGALSHAAGGALLSGTGTIAGLSAAKSIKNRDILKNLATADAPNSGALSMSQLKRLPKMMPTKNILRYGGAAGLLGGLAGLGYHALSDEGADSPPSGSPENTIDDTRSADPNGYGDNELRTTEPGDSTEMNPRVESANPSFA